MTAWNIDRAVVTRWTEAGLDAAFRAEWADPSRTDYPTLHEAEAEPSAPGPYCVFQHLPSPVPVGNMTGKVVAKQHQLQHHTIRFEVHAKESATESPKDIAIRLAELVQTAFDSQAAWDLGSTIWHVHSTRGPDWGVREGDNEYMVTVQYEVLIDVQLPAVY